MSFPAEACSSTTPTTRTRSRCAPRWRYLAERAGDRRRVAILGDMAELGPHRPDYHREIGAAAAELGVDELLAVGELARGYLEGGVSGRWVRERPRRVCGSWTSWSARAMPCS